MPSEEQYDAIIIGSGQGGGPFAGALAKAGRKTALVERLHVGGSCINEGCTPTKTMVASARVAYLARRGADYGVRVGGVSVDMGAVRARKRAIVEEFRGGSEEHTRNAKGLDLIMGDARFSGPKTVKIVLRDGGSRVLTAPLIVIDTGARPAMPPIEGLEGAGILDSTSIMELDAVPERLLVLGGGYVGLEFGQMFRRFGSEVTLIEQGPRLLGHEDADVAEATADILREDGIEIMLGAEALRVERPAAGGIRLILKTPDGERAHEGSHLLVAAGRVPNTDSLSLQSAGVTTNSRGFIPVNDRLETNVAGIYALGDVNGGPAFTHISYDDYRIMKTNLLDGGNRTTAGRLVPYTVFIDPELARIGLSEQDARAAGRAIRVAKMPMTHVARTLEVDESRGMMKAIVDAGSDQILGCAILGIEGGEIMAMLEIAMLGGVTASILRDAVFSHPTLAEALNNLLR